MIKFVFLMLFFFFNWFFRAQDTGITAIDSLINCDTSTIVEKKLDTNWVEYKSSAIATCYGWKFHGRKTASGRIFDQWGSTVAHNHLKFGTVLRVTDLGTGNSEIVTVTDTGKLGRGVEIDLSRGTMQRISGKDFNKIKIKIEIMKVE